MHISILVLRQVNGKNINIHGLKIQGMYILEYQQLQKNSKIMKIQINKGKHLCDIKLSRIEFGKN